jgi:group I intron endonuclease
MDGRLYIGSSTQHMHGRVSTHFGQLVRNKHKNEELQKAWNKYGQSAFHWFALEAVTDISQLLIREQAWINKYKSDQLFNVYLDVLPGKKMPASSRAKLSVTNKGQGLGRKLSPETCAKMSASRTGRKLTEAHKAATSKGRLGMRFSDEHRANLSAAQRRRYSKKLGEHSC